LSALEVLASLFAVGYVKRRILPRDTAIRDLIKNDVLRVCAELSVNGVDDDVEEWASDPVTIMVSWRRHCKCENCVRLFETNVVLRFSRTMCRRGKRTIPLSMPSPCCACFFSHWEAHWLCL
jgi:hypothetical protein